jgi:hypothetical protein
MTDISVRSALKRVRWNDMPVRREESSTETLSDPAPEVILVDSVSLMTFSSQSACCLDASRAAAR